MIADLPRASAHHMPKNGRESDNSLKSGRDSGHSERYPDLACADTFAHSGNNAQMDQRDSEMPRTLLENRLIRFYSGGYTCRTFSIEEAGT
jgi:hypothetical protein